MVVAAKADPRDGDMDKTVSFYCEVLGMVLEEFTSCDGAEPRKFLKCGEQKINLPKQIHQADNLTHANSNDKYLDLRSSSVD